MKKMIRKYLLVINILFGITLYSQVNYTDSLVIDELNLTIYKNDTSFLFNNMKDSTIFAENWRHTNQKNSLGIIFSKSDFFLYAPMKSVVNLLGKPDQGEYEYYLESFTGDDGKYYGSSLKFICYKGFISNLIFINR